MRQASLPIIWMILIVLLVLTYFFGWIVWPIVVALIFLISGCVWVRDRVVEVRARRQAKRDLATWPDVEADWTRDMASPEPTDPSTTAEHFAEFMNARGYNFDFTISNLVTEVDTVFEEPVFVRGAEELRWKTEGSLGAYIGETLARTFDGQWAGVFDQAGPGANFYMSYVKLGDYSFFPSHFVGYRLSNGPSEGTFRDYLEGELPAIRERKETA